MQDFIYASDKFWSKKVASNGWPQTPQTWIRHTLLFDNLMTLTVNTFKMFEALAEEGKYLGGGGVKWLIRGVSAAANTPSVMRKSQPGFYQNFCSTAKCRTPHCTRDKYTQGRLCFKANLKILCDGKHFSIWLDWILENILKFVPKYFGRTVNHKVWADRRVM